MKEKSAGLFSNEESIITSANTIIDKFSSDSAYRELINEYGKLLDSYKKNIRETKILVKLSDSQQKALIRAKSEIENLNQVVQQISMSLDLDTVLEKMLDYLNKNFNFEVCFLTLIDKENECYKFEKCVGIECLNIAIIEYFDNKLFNMENEEDEIARCLKTNKALFLPYSQYHQLFNTITVPMNKVSLAILPVNVDNQLIGTFVMSATKPLTLTDEEKERIEQFANYVSVVIKNSKLYKDANEAILKHIKENNQALRTLNNAYSRFVPLEFLEMLEKKDILDVKYGDCVVKEMSVLFSDIRNFTGLSENMWMEENFEFLNSFLSIMEPVIQENKGFIDKYLGDGLMALFKGNADDALTAGITMLKRLRTFNDKRIEENNSPIEIGIGINTGALMLGTIGGKTRMDGTVIGDTVNIASRVEDLTKMYKIPLLITFYTYTQLKNPLYYHMRFIDIVQVKGKIEKIAIFEVFDADPPETFALKNKTLNTFSKAVDDFYACNYSAAKEGFIRCIDDFPNDHISYIYLDRIENILKNRD